MQINTHENKEKFTQDQIAEVKKGIASGLSPNQVEFYRKDFLSCSKMRLIRDALKPGIPENKLAICLNKAFTDEQVSSICFALRSYMPDEQIAVFAKPEFSHKQMQMIITGFRLGLSIEQTSLFADSKLSASRMEQCIRGFVDGLSVLQVKSLTDTSIPICEAEEKREQFTSANEEFKKTLSESYFKLSDDQISALLYGLQNGLSKKQIDVIAKETITPEQMRWLINTSIRDASNSRKIKNEKNTHNERD